MSLRSVGASNVLPPHARSYIWLSKSCGIVGHLFAQWCYSLPTHTYKYKHSFINTLLYSLSYAFILLHCFGVCTFAELCSCVLFTFSSTSCICSCTYPFGIQQIHNEFPVIIQLQWLCKYSIFCYLVLCFLLAYVAFLASQKRTSKEKLICASLFVDPL